MDFGKVLTAMITPFDQEGNIDFDKTSELVEYLIANGTDGLVVAGTTGESPTLSTDEKVQLFNHVVKVVNKRVPVIAGTGSNNTATSISLTKKAEASGVDGIMLVAPYYNKPNQQGLYEHFKTIANETKLPVMLYNIPGRSVVKMSSETIIRLSEIDNIVSVKEASGDLDQVAEIIENTSDDFSLYSGDDGLTLPMLAVGAHGVVSVASHVIGNEMQSMIDHYVNGRNKEAASGHRKLLPVMNALFSAPSPTPVKAALKLKGLDVGSVRLPLVPLTEDELNNIKNVIL
ncbi:4-hydroxy-tetrahydrodipicolinate synthase [Ornithinibacillus sp. L9]|uniref:4-hydroxy-tetrahydrodipicolinate synthase n=1 Tax=Ornithinibacillus caprae TaxID=2678566 RepID=A0A6N8FPR4_9BACI|nr:4-hydroxy-tetrahydrodipicolinate synthase [Ornithinibacillus caprae]MUK89859.1 4-hydroxy-tetrahydrodipicolinate synthase [Ornithinibacillus caprae]